MACLVATLRLVILFAQDAQNHEMIPRRGSAFPAHNRLSQNVELKGGPRTLVRYTVALNKQRCQLLSWQTQYCIRRSLPPDNIYMERVNIYHLAWLLERFTQFAGVNIQWQVA